MQSAPHAAKWIEQRGRAPGLVNGGRVVRKTDRKFKSPSLQRRGRVSQMVKKRRRGGRMIVTTRVRELCRARLVTPLDAAARWNGRGDEEAA
jgi:hypothetical protein